MKIGFIGNGWRTHGYWRIVKQVPEEFEISGVLFHTPEKAKDFKLGPAYTSLDEFLKADHDMVFILVPWDWAFYYVKKCTEAGFPVLVETPPACNMDQLTEMWEFKEKTGAKIQVAEQYFLQPYHAAALKLVENGVLGDVSNLRIAVAHDYHGISLLRHYLGVGQKKAKITARSYSFPVLKHIGRDGLQFGADQVGNDGRKVADFVFETEEGACPKVAFFDFAGEQYFNYFRSRHLNIQGTLGEINDYDVSYWKDGMPFTSKLFRQDMGKDSNLEGYFHRGFYFDGQQVYESPFAKYPEARLTDDEIGMGSLLLGMKEMIAGGPEIYPLKEALQDTYLYFKMDEAIKSGGTVETDEMPWNG